MTLTDGDIIRMRSTVSSETLAGTCVIQTLTNTSDSEGGATQTWAASGTVACHVAPLYGGESEQGDRIASTTGWVLTIPALTSITVQSRVVTGGVTYEVIRLHAPRTYEVSRRVELREVD